MNAYKNVSYAMLVIVLGGIVVTIYGGSFLIAQLDLEAKGVRVKGKVFEINKKAIYRSPWVKFKTLEGKEIIFLSEFEVNVDLFKYRIGQEVDVIYHMDDPNNCKIDAFWENNFAQLFLGCFGVFLIVLGLVLRAVFRRKAKRWVAQSRA